MPFVLEHYIFLLTKTSPATLQRRVLGAGVQKEAWQGTWYISSEIYLDDRHEVIFHYLD